jgi:hypothetical protein
MNGRGDRSQNSLGTSLPRPVTEAAMLRSLMCSTLLLALSTTAVPAQTKVKEARPGKVELVRIENSLAAGLVTRDSALFNKYLASKFVYTENDVLIRRDAMLKMVTTGSDTVRTARNEGMEVHQFGSTTAAVTGWLIVEGRGKGGAFTHRYRFTDTWVKRKSDWQLVVAQDYLVPN